MHMLPHIWDSNTCSIIPPLQIQDWFVTLDFKDAYFHTASHLAHRKYFRFMLGPNHYQYKTLPLGLSTAPRDSVRYLILVAAHLRKMGIYVYPYIAGCLIRGGIASRNFDNSAMPCVCTQLCILVNCKKLSFILSDLKQQSKLGAGINSTTARALSLQKTDSSLFCH